MERLRVFVAFHVKHLSGPHRDGVSACLIRSALSLASNGSSLQIEDVRALYTHCWVDASLHGRGGRNQRARRAVEKPALSGGKVDGVTLILVQRVAQPDPRRLHGSVADKSVTIRRKH